MYPNALNALINDLKKLPSIGEKTAERLALYIVTKGKRDDIISASLHLINVTNELHLCQTCYMLKEDHCIYCDDTMRDMQQMMVVSEIKDVYLIEKLGSFNGTYHVLGGLIDFSLGIDERSLNIESLITRVKNGPVKEVILALNSTVEGEITGNFIKKQLSQSGVKISALASGIPYGSELKYSDEVTLRNALKYRKEL